MGVDSRVFRFGDFHFDPTSGELRQGDRTERLAPQVALVLDILLERAGQMVSRDEFRRRVWPNVTVEFDQGLNFCIRQLRVALDEDAERPRFIETLPKRGYRFCAPVSTDEPLAPPSIVEERASPRRATRFLASAGVAIICLAALVGWATRVVSSHSTVLAIVPFDADASVAGLATYGDALTETLITRITNRAAPAMSIVGPAFTRRFGSRTPIDTIHAAIAADYALSGVIHQSANGVDVFAQLVRASDRGHIWAFRVVDSASDGGALLGARIADSVNAIILDRRIPRRALGYEKAAKR